MVRNVSVEAPNCLVPPPRLEWSVCIPTLNRIDVLELALRCVLSQKRLPKEVIIVDASDDWEDHRDRLAALFEGQEVRFMLHPAQERSSAVQRNQALYHVTGDIVFFIDDDTLMFDDCAETLLSAFEHDVEKQIAAIGMTHIEAMPEAAQNHGHRPAVELDRKSAAWLSEAKELLRANALMNFLRRDILMMQLDRMFVPYDAPNARAQGHALAGCYLSAHLPGYGMSVRRSVAVSEPFSDALLAYCPMEDLDASYRWGRHGVCLMMADARIHHYEVGGSRVTRMQATMLGITNMAYFMRSNGAVSPGYRARFAIYGLRRILGETLKDILTGRLRFPQGRGAVAALPVGLKIMSRDSEGLRDWYLDRQRRILAHKE